MKVIIKLSSNCIPKNAFGQVMVQELHTQFGFTLDTTPNPLEEEYEDFLILEDFKIFDNILLAPLLEKFRSFQRVEFLPFLERPTFVIDVSEV